MRLDDSNDLNVEDQRGGGYNSAGLGGGGGGLGLISMLVPFVFSRFGCTGVAILGLAFLLFGGLGSIGSLIAPSATTSAPHQSAQGNTAGAGQGGNSVAASCSVDAASRFSCNALASVNQTWAKLLPGYTPPKLVFYAGNEIGRAHV